MQAQQEPVRPQAGRTNVAHQIDVALKRQDFTPLDADECVYIKRHSAQITIIALYVDDLLIACSSSAELTQLKQNLIAQLDMEDLGEASFMLGIDIRRDRPTRTISIGQSAYVTSILERHGMSDSAPVSTPMQHDHKATLVKPPADHEATDSATREYQAIIGAVMFAMICTRPDIAFAVNILAQFASNPTTAHQQALKCILQYLRGTIDRRITYTGTSANDLYLSSAATATPTGVVALVSAPSLATHFCWPAEPSAGRAGGRRRSHCRLSKLSTWSPPRPSRRLSGGGPSSPTWASTRPRPTTLFSDSQGSIALAHNPEHHARTKHIAIRYHFIREHVAEKTVALTFVGTADMAADLFTQALDRVAYERGERQLGLTAPSSRGGVEASR